MPKELNALEWAKSGYINIDANKIKCIYCQHLVHFKSQPGVVIPDQTLQRMVNRVIYGHKPDCIFYKTRTKETHKSSIGAMLPRVYSLRKAHKKSSEGEQVEVDVEGLKERIQTEARDEFLHSFTKFYLNWDVQFLENLKSFEDAQKEIGDEGFVMPLVDPEVLNLLAEDWLDILWLKNGNLLRPTKDSFYVPAILALFGWKAELNGKHSYDLVCEEGWRRVPVSILVTESGNVQSWSSNQAKVEQEDLSSAGKSGVELAEWVKNKTQFLLHPVKEHMEFCPQIINSEERYKLKLKMIQR